MSNLIQISNQNLTMSSREIAQLVEKRHDNVKRTIDALVNSDVISFPQIEEKPTAGRPVTEYIFSGEQGKRDSIIVVAQLCPEFTARLVDRWQELEAQVSSTAIAIPQTLPEALRLAADLADQVNAVTAERDHAIATKALIGSKREATAMATASAASTKARKLEAELGRNQRHATIIAVERATGKKLPKNAYVSLRRSCKRNNLSTVEVVDARYGTVKAWPADAWMEAHNINLCEVMA